MEELNNNPEQQEQQLEQQEQQPEVLEQQEPAVKYVMLAVSNKKKRKLVEDAGSLASGDSVDGIAVVTPEASFVITLHDGVFPFGDGPSDMAENDITIGGGYLDGQERTDWLIDWFHLEAGTACVEAKNAGGWLPSVGEMEIIFSHLEEINALLEAAGGDILSGEYWTSQLYSADYPWHMDTQKGFRMWRGKPSALKVRAISGIDGYQQ